MQKSVKILYFILVLALGLVPIWAAPTPPPIHFSTETLSIQTASGPRHYTVELALTPAQQELGLMHRKKLARDHGMLFVMPKDEIIHMWMKNTALSLDMVFVNSGGTIVSITENAVPENIDIISSKQTARGVIELLAGTAQADDIHVGDKVLSSYFGTAP